MNNSSIVSLVKANLAQQQLWDFVEESQLNDLDAWVISGVPPHKLSNDDKDLEREWILPVDLKQYSASDLTLEIADKLFAELICRRIILGIANDDGTVVYYFMYKGLHKPKKN
ncbi:LANO_0E13410g1_1 [Lachancea nothofagi CBS 11611]|uniref:LANO_0E13410g1_1 n=1 Tax=Lachancea nothofagi CBS 11611 TaxID=1266666 RepID=A0A1G4JYY2_9SACH|nr:LANO_0E13410g1_1 [Lachancea nothofagi CBS 11611]